MWLTEVRSRGQRRRVSIFYPGQLGLEGSTIQVMTTVDGQVVPTIGYLDLDGISDNIIGRTYDGFLDLDGPAIRVMTIVEGAVAVTDGSLDLEGNAIFVHTDVPAVAVTEGFLDLEGSTILVSEAIGVSVAEGFLDLEGPAIIVHKEGGAPTFANGFAKRAEIVIPVSSNKLVSAASFVLYLVETQDAFKSKANGGFLELSLTAQVPTVTSPFVGFEPQHGLDATQTLVDPTIPTGPFTNNGRVFFEPTQNNRTLDLRDVTLPMNHVSGSGQADILTVFNNRTGTIIYGGTFIGDELKRNGDRITWGMFYQGNGRQPNPTQFPLSAPQPKAALSPFPAYTVDIPTQAHWREPSRTLIGWADNCIAVTTRLASDAQHDVVIENSRIYGQTDFISPDFHYVVTTGYTIVRGCHVKWHHDDLFELDSENGSAGLKAKCYDCLIEDSHAFVSFTDTPAGQKAVFVGERILYHGARHPYDYGGAPDQGGNPVAGSKFTDETGNTFASNTNPWALTGTWNGGAGYTWGYCSGKVFKGNALSDIILTLKDSIFYLHSIMNPGNSSMDFPAGTYSNVLILWAGAGDFPGSLPAADVAAGRIVLIERDNVTPAEWADAQATWDTAVAAWMSARGAARMSDGSLDWPSLHKATASNWLDIQFEIGDRLIPTDTISVLEHMPLIHDETTGDLACAVRIPATLMLPGTAISIWCYAGNPSAVAPPSNGTFQDFMQVVDAYTGRDLSPNARNMVSASYVSPYVSVAATIGLTRPPADIIIPSSYNINDGNNFNVAAGKTLDLRNITFQMLQASGGSAITAARVATGTCGDMACFYGGKIIGVQPRTLTWYQMKHDAFHDDPPASWNAGGHTEPGYRTTAGSLDSNATNNGQGSGNTILFENMVVVNCQDSLNLAGLTAYKSIYRGCYVEYNRDDSIENDGGRLFEVYDCFINGTHMFLSNSGGAESVPHKIYNTLVLMERKPYTTDVSRNDPNRYEKYDAPWPGGNIIATGDLRRYGYSHGTLFKDGTNNNVDMRDCVIGLQGFPGASFTWARGTYSNVLLIWMGTDNLQDLIDFGNAHPTYSVYPLPTGVTAVASGDGSLWAREAIAWITAHHGVVSYYAADAVSSRGLPYCNDYPFLHR